MRFDNVKQALLITSFLLISAMGGCLGENILSNDIQTVIQELVDNGYAVGIVVGVLDSNKTEFYGYGKLSQNGDQTVDEDTIFEIGSITKVFTTLILADMIEKGELGLNDPIENFLPVKVPTKNGKRITLEHLATHTSGLPRMPDNFAPENWSNPYRDYTVENMYEFLSSYTLTRDPGTQYEYSNLGMGLLGHVLSLESGMTFEELVKNRICDEVGLENTTISLTPQQQVRLAKGHQVDVENWDFDALAGAGALRSSAKDMLMFLSAEMGLKKTKLYPAMENTQTTHFSIDASGGEIGLGWIIPHVNSEIIFHDGMTGGYCSFAGFDKENQKAVVVLSSIASVGIVNHVENIGLHILDPGIELKTPKKAVEVDTSVYDDYVGEYEMAPNFIITISRDGDRLFARATGQDRFEIFPLSETRYFYMVVDAEIEFLRDEDGQVNELILYQYGEEYSAKRA